MYEVPTEFHSHEEFLSHEATRGGAIAPPRCSVRGAALMLLVLDFLRSYHFEAHAHCDVGP